MNEDQKALWKVAAEEMTRNQVREISAFRRLFRERDPHRLLYWQRAVRVKGFQMFSDPRQAPASLEPPIPPEDAKAIFAVLGDAYAMLGYRLDWFVTDPQPASPERPDGLWACPRNEPTGEYGRHHDFSRCHFLTADGNGFAAAIRALTTVPPLQGSGLRVLKVTDADLLFVSMRAIRLQRELLAYLDAARARRADPPPAIPAILPD